MAEGAISWWELDVPDIEKAKQFYGAVLPAWTLQPMEGYEGYVIVNVEGAGIGALQGSEAGAPSGRPVTLYFLVADLEGTLERARQAGGTVEQVKTFLVGSPEYMEVRGGGTNNGFLTALYQDALNRAPDSSGSATFTQALAQGTSRREVAVAVLGSTEHLGSLVTNAYEQFLKRAPDDGGLNAYVQALRAGVADQNVMAALLGSDEFFSHV